MSHQPQAYKNRLTARLSAGRFIPGLDQRDKLLKMCEAFFDPSDTSVRSFREVYVALTGDRDCTGRIENCDRAILREAVDSGSLGNILGNAMRRQLLRDYQNKDRFDVWREIAKATNVADFRLQHRTRFGGYGDLPLVAEGQPYGALQTPPEEEVTYQAQKRGGTESMTLESIKNDDVGLIQRIPKKLAEAAKRTLAKFVLDFIRSNPVIYDGLPLFHANHGNIGTAPLSAAAVSAGRATMRRQTEPGSGDDIRNEPRKVLVPYDLEETAFNIFRQGANNEKTFAERMSLDVFPVWYWTDVNDWCLVADLIEIPTIEISFLDGVDEPDIFLQDNPSVGSLFTNDQITWKIRHIYGGNVLDYRGFYKSVVP
jgi:hypothetical protein